MTVWQVDATTDDGTAWHAIAIAATAADACTVLGDHIRAARHVEQAGIDSCSAHRVGADRAGEAINRVA